jgi:hypothetical protein
MARPRFQLSISESSDLAALGLTPEHMRAALLDIVRLLLRRGYDIVYGGDLRRAGFTEDLAALVRQQQEFPQDHDAQLIWPVVAGANASEDAARRWQMEWFGKATLELVPSPAPGLAKADLMTHLRRHMAASTVAILAIGGKTDGFSGARPGVIEEIEAHCAGGHPVYLIPSFGGATAAAALGVRLPDYLAPHHPFPVTGTLAPAVRDFAEKAAETPEPAGLVALLAGALGGR